MSVAVFSDLDGTLIYSRRLAGDVAGLEPVESIDGEPQSWMTRTAAENLRTLTALVAFVPTTTRTPEQYQRVRLPGVPPEYAILSNGAHILTGGAEDREWSTVIGDSSWGVTRPEIVAGNLTGALDGARWVRRIQRFDTIVCVSAERGSAPSGDDEKLIQQVAVDHGYGAYRQGRKMHLIPAHVTKEAAADHVACKLGATSTVAAGDHALDHGLLDWAHHAIQPAHGVHIAGVRTTSSSGASAGEEITTFFLESASAGA